MLFVVVLGLGRRIGPSALSRIEPHVASPRGFIALIALLVLLVSSASEALGVPAFLGAFLIGVALGDASERQREAHDVIGHVVTSFAPIYFISMGMSTNFIANFDPVLVAVILVVACISKMGRFLPARRPPGCRWIAKPGRSALASTPAVRPASSWPESGWPTGSSTRASSSPLL